MSVKVNWKVLWEAIRLPLFVIWVLITVGSVLFVGWAWVMASETTISWAAYVLGGLPTYITAIFLFGWTSKLLIKWLFTDVIVITKKEKDDEFNLYCTNCGVRLLHVRHRKRHKITIIKDYKFLNLPIYCSDCYEKKEYKVETWTPWTVSDTTGTYRPIKIDYQYK